MRFLSLEIIIFITKMDSDARAFGLFNSNEQFLRGFGQKTR